MSADEATEAIESIDEPTLIRALESNDPRVARLAADVTAAQADVEAARVRPSPRIAVDREETFPSDGRVPTSYFRLVLPLEISGRRGREIAAAKAQVRAAQARSEIGTDSLVVEGLRLHRETQYLRLRLAVMNDGRAALVRALDIVAKRARAGEASGYDQQRLELEVASYEDLVTSATIELRAAQRRLAGLIGRSEARVDATGDLAVGSASSAAALVADSLASRGDYRAAKHRLDAASEERAAADRAWIPTLEVTAGAMSQAFSTETGYGYVAGLSLSLPIGHSAAARANAEATRRAADADAKLLERQVPTAIRIALDTWAARIDQAKAFQAAQLVRLDQLLRSAEAAYREGGGSIVELLDAYRSAREVRLRELELRRDASLAELDLWLALGRHP